MPVLNMSDTKEEELSTVRGKLNHCNQPRDFSDFFKGSDSTQTQIVAPTHKVKDALTEFTIFPKLPPEVQIKIWKNTIPASRLIRVKVQENADNIQFSTNISVPVLLSVCHTSRETILKVYSACLESGDRMIRFDGDNDILVLFSIPKNARPPSTFVFYGQLPWFRIDKMTCDLQRVFSGVKNLALVYYRFAKATKEQQRWFLSQFQSLKCYYPLDECTRHNLDANKEGGICFTVHKDQRVLFDAEIMPNWMAFAKQLRSFETMHQGTLRMAEKLDCKFEIVPAMVCSRP
jgi:hypothetical protein